MAVGAGSLSSRLWVLTQLREPEISSCFSLLCMMRWPPLAWDPKEAHFLGQKSETLALDSQKKDEVARSKALGIH